MAAGVPPSLTDNKLLAGLAEPELRRVAALLRPRRYAAGDSLIRQSDPPSEVYLLGEGRVQVRRSIPGVEEGAIAELGAGDICGEMAVISSAAAHSSSVTALTAVGAWSLSTEDFRALLDSVPGLLRNVLRSLVSQMQGLNNRWLLTLQEEKEELEAKVRERTAELAEIGQRVSRELALAQTIQRNLLPEKRRTWPMMSITAEYVPCTELGGDITGVFPIDETRVGIYGGDVSGHGIYAAMVMSFVKKLIESSVKRILLNRQYVVKPPGAVLTTINRSFMAEISQGDPEIYLTLFLGVLDMTKLTMEYSSAGIHCPPLVLSGGTVQPLFTQSDFSIGHVPDHEYATARRSFAAGDAFLFVSDGVIEANAGAEPFGMERLKAEALRLHGGSGGIEAVTIIDSVRSFLRGTSPEDDMCVLSIDFRPPAPAGP